MRVFCLISAISNTLKLILTEILVLSPIAYH